MVEIGKGPNMTRDKEKGDKRIFHKKTNSSFLFIIITLISVLTYYIFKNDLIGEDSFFILKYFFRNDGSIFLISIISILLIMSLILIIWTLFLMLLTSLRIINSSDWKNLSLIDKDELIFELETLREELKQIDPNNKLKLDEITTSDEMKKYLIQRNICSFQIEFIFLGIILGLMFLLWIFV